MVALRFTPQAFRKLLRCTLRRFWGFRSCPATAPEGAVTRRWLGFLWGFGFHPTGGAPAPLGESPLSGGSEVGGHTGAFGTEGGNARGSQSSPSTQKISAIPTTTTENLSAAPFAIPANFGKRKGFLRSLGRRLLRVLAPQRLRDFALRAQILGYGVYADHRGRLFGWQEATEMDSRGRLLVRRTFVPLPELQQFTNPLDRSGEVFSTVRDLLGRVKSDDRWQPDPTLSEWDDRN